MDPRFLTLLFLGLAIPSTAGSPACLKPPFRGITERDEVGEVVGHVDPRDWGCAGSDHGGPTPQSAADVPVPPPFDLCFHGAYPNPTDGAVRMTFSLTSTGNVTLSLYGQTHRHGRPEAYPVRVLIDAALVSGVHEVTWDLLDENGTRVEPGIYRAVLEAQGQVFCGDIGVK
jgi:hypothetical protein